MKRINLTDCDITDLVAGDEIFLSGEVFTARDAAHKRLADCIAAGTVPPFELRGAAVYYTGPTPSVDGEIIGSCGPTTSARMDEFTPALLDLGLRVMIGKGQRSREVDEAIGRNRAVYLVAVGGAAALIKSCVIKNEEVAYGDLGCEAIRRLTFVDLPLLVAVDSRGNSIFQK